MKRKYLIKTIPVGLALDSRHFLLTSENSYFMKIIFKIYSHIIYTSVIQIFLSCNTRYFVIILPWTRYFDIILLWARYFTILKSWTRVLYCSYILYHSSASPALGIWEANWTTLIYVFKINSYLNNTIF